MKIFLFLLGFTSLTLAGKTTLCASDSDCQDSLCVQSVCLSASQLRDLADVYLPPSALLLSATVPPAC